MFGEEMGFNVQVSGVAIASLLHDLVNARDDCVSF